jgi:hypothetical protein
MKKLLAASLSLVFLAGVAYGLGSKPPGNTGDRQLNSTLEQINIAAKDDPDGFIKQLSSRHNIPEQQLRQAREGYHLGAADLFMAAALAKATHRPVLSVAEKYKQNEGRGWGVIAQDMGIKPGSREFHELKRDARGSLDHMKAVAKSKQKHEQETKREREQKMKKGAQGKGHGESR